MKQFHASRRPTHQELAEWLKVHTIGGGAATFEFEEDNGAAAGSPAKGTTRTAARTESNWKNIDDSTTAYTSNPITAGNNSYQKNQFGHFSGTFNQILNGLFAHTATAFGTGLTLKGV